MAVDRRREILFGELDDARGASRQGLSLFQERARQRYD
jgi:hypothetical protein